MTKEAATLVAIELGSCSGPVQAKVGHHIFAEFKDGFAQAGVLDEHACLQYFLTQEKGTIKRMYVVLRRRAGAAVLVGTVGVCCSDFQLHISNLLVLPKWRTRGYGSAILSFAEQACCRMGFGFANLWCDAELVPFYQRAGWKPEKSVQIDKEKWVQTMSKPLT